MRACARGLAAAILAAVPAGVLAAPPPGAASCLGCHPAVPTDSPVLSLAMLKAEQIETAMKEYRADTRPATVMNRIATGYSDQEVRAIAQWYAGAKGK